jgi:hypothetical protein
MIPAKAFEYLRAGQPILALAPAGATADLLKEMPHCHVINPEDSLGLSNAVAALYCEWRDSSAAVLTTRASQRFERAALTAELAAILNDAAGSHHSV